MGQALGLWVCKNEQNEIKRDMVRFISACVPFPIQSRHALHAPGLSLHPSLTTTGPDADVGAPSLHWWKAVAGEVHGMAFTTTEFQPKMLLGCYRAEASSQTGRIPHRHRIRRDSWTSQNAEDESFGRRSQGRKTNACSC